MGLTKYYTPTKVIFGEGALSQLPSLVNGYKKVLVHYGSGRIRTNGLFDQVTSLLEEAGAKWIPLGGVVPNPRLSLVREGIALCRKEGVDLVLAIGGGSVMDSAKCIGYGVAYDGDVWDFYSQKATPQASLPTACVLTMAAAGSEMSDSSVITNEDGWLKRGCNSDVCRPRFAILDPTLTYTLPPYQTAAATVDIMMHTMERYFTSGESLPLTDNLATALLRTVMEAGEAALRKSDDRKARADLMWASSLSHNGLMAMGNDTRGDWACHQLEHELSGMFDVAHGAGLAAIWPSWARYCIARDPSRFAKLGYSIFSLKPSGDMAADAEATVEAFEDFCTRIGMPTRISGLGIDLTEEQIDQLAHKCSFEGKRTIGAYMKLDEAAMREVYRAAK